MLCASGERAVLASASDALGFGVSALDMLRGLSVQDVELRDRFALHARSSARASAWWGAPPLKLETHHVTGLQGNFDDLLSNLS